MYSRYFNLILIYTIIINIAPLQVQHKNQIVASCVL